MSPKLMRITGGGLLLSQVLTLSTAGYLLIQAGQNDNLSRSLGLLSTLLEAPLVLAFFWMLRPVDGPKALATALAGGVGYIIRLANAVLIMTQMITPKLTSDPERDIAAASGLLVGVWLFWSNYSAWRHQILRGRLALLGIAAGICLFLGSLAPFISLDWPPLLLTLWFVIILLPSAVLIIAEPIWAIWLGILLIGDRVTAHA